VFSGEGLGKLRRSLVAKKEAEGGVGQGADSFVEGGGGGLTGLPGELRGRNLQKREVSGVKGRQPPFPVIKRRLYKGGKGTLLDVGERSVCRKSGKEEEKPGRELCFKKGENCLWGAKGLAQVVLADTP